MKITGSTRLTGIFGDPITHTLSPVMHNAAFAALDLDMVYVPFHVQENDLKRAVESIRALNIAGVNVTVPHKERVVKYLDAMDDGTRVIGAVNTVVNKGGQLKGYNTDAMGYMRSLREDCGFDPKKKKVVIAGAGGSARAVLYELLAVGVVSATIVNRTPSRGARLADEYAGLFLGAQLQAYGLDRPDELRVALESADILINATAAGLMGKGELDVPLERLPKGAIVSDIVYSPLETAFLKKAKALGLRTHSGIGMLVHQGAASFELWTGHPAPVGVMKAAVLDALKTLE